MDIFSNSRLLFHDSKTAYYTGHFCCNMGVFELLRTSFFADWVMYSDSVLLFLDIFIENNGSTCVYTLNNSGYPNACPPEGGPEGPLFPLSFHQNTLTTDIKLKWFEQFSSFVQTIIITYTNHEPNETNCMEKDPVCPRTLLEL